MAEEQPWRRPAPDGAGIALEIVQRVPRDLVFVMRFLGESPHRLMRHFQGFIRAETARRGATPEEYPLLAHFVDLHAAELRDFVLAGTALTRQFRAEEIEQLTGDSTGLLRLDIWDALKSHVETAERRFLLGAEDLPRMLATMGVDRRPGAGP
ncbi:MAG: hypothetical protein U1E17_07195 [Geminicoccaceae bacterium]